MKLSAAITIAFVCFTMLTASAQITTKAKTDTSNKPLFKLSDDFDYFLKTSKDKKEDSSSLDINAAFAGLNSFLDGSQNWKAQKSNTDIFVTTASPCLIPTTMMALL